MSDWKMSESIAALAPAIVAAQAEICAAAKDAVNPHFGNRYADLASVIEAVKSATQKHAIAILQPVTTDGGVACITTLLLHSSGEYIASTLRIPVTKNDAQGVGSAISYGRRYGLQAMLRVPAADDDGNDASTVTTPRPAARQVPPPPARTESTGDGASPGDVVLGFGKFKGYRLGDIEKDYLQWLRGQTKQNIDDPSKERFRTRDLTLLSQIESVLGVATAPAVAPENGYSDDIPF